MDIEVAKLQRLVNLLPEGERRRCYQERLRDVLEGSPCRMRCQADPQSTEQSEALISRNPDAGYPESLGVNGQIVWKGRANEL